MPQASDNDNQQQDPNAGAGNAGQQNPPAIINPPAVIGAAPVAAVGTTDATAGQQPADGTVQSAPGAGAVAGQVDPADGSAGDGSSAGTVQPAGTDDAATGADAGAVSGDANGAPQQGGDDVAGGTGDSAVGGEDDANAVSGTTVPPSDAGAAGAGSADAEVAGAGASGDVSANDQQGGGSVSGDGQDTGGDQLPDARAVDIDALTAWLDSHSVAYKKTQAADGTVGYPVWVESSDLEVLVTIDPTLAALEGNAIAVATVPLTDVGNAVTVVAVVPVDPAIGQSDTGDADVGGNASPDGTDSTSGDAGNGASGASTGTAASDTSAPDASGAVVAPDAGLLPTDPNTIVTPVIPVPTPLPDTTQVVGDGNGGQTQVNQDPAQGQADQGAGGGGSDAGPAGTNDGTADQPAAGADSTGSGAAATGGDATDPSNTPGADAGAGDATGTGTAPVVTPVAPVVVPPVTNGTVDGDSGRQLTDTTVNQFVQNLIKDVDSVGKGVVEEIYQYISRMRPNMPLTPEEGARNQQALYATLKTLFNRVENDFTAVFPAVLKLFEHHSNGVFAMTHRFRFMEAARSMSGEDRNTFQHMVHMLITVAPVQGRQQALNQLNLAKALPAPHVNEGGRNRVNSFFNR